MKRILAIPALALAAVALTGCDEIGGGGGEDNPLTWTEDMLVEIVERPTDGSPSITTRLEWSKQGAQIKETQTMNGEIVYEDVIEHPTSSNNVRTRTIHNADGTTSKQRRETSFIDIQGIVWERSLTVYNLDSDGNVIRPAAERFEYERDYLGNPIKYWQWESDGEKEVLVKYQYDFDYGYDQAQFWQQNSEDSADRVRMYHVSIKKGDLFDGSYRMYAGDPMNGGVKVEEKNVSYQGIFNQDYTLTRWDPETEEKIYDSSFALRSEEFTFYW